MEETKEIQPEQVPAYQCPSCQPKVTTIVILLIAIFLIGAVGVYAGIQIGEKKMSGGLLTKVTPTSVPQPTEIPALDETANWKVLQISLNKETKKLELRYPSE